MLPVKKQIISILEEQSFHELSSLSASHHKVVTILISLSYDKKKTLAWRAIEAVGVLSKDIAEIDAEKVRNIVGRLLWMLRDESGGIGWSAPEMLGEIVRNNPELCADIAPIIVSFHEEIMLAAGAFRATGRIGNLNNETTGYAIPLLLHNLNSEDANVRGNAVYALGELGAVGAKFRLESMRDDNGRLDFYDNGELQSVTVSEIASAALTKMFPAKTG